MLVTRALAYSLSYPGALGASLAMAGNIVGPLLFFFGWNIIRMAFLWYTQELGYKAGSEITKDLSGGIIQKITKGASILGMFILAVLVERWVSIRFTVNLPSTKLSEGAYIEFPKGNVTGTEHQGILGKVADGLSLSPEKANTLQGQLNSLIPGLMGLALTFLCMWLLKKKFLQSQSSSDCSSLVSLVSSESCNKRKEGFRSFFFYYVIIE